MIGRRTDSAKRAPKNPRNGYQQKIKLYITCRLASDQSDWQCGENNSPELEIVDVIMAVDSESDEDYTQPRKFRRTAAQNTWIEEHVAEGTYVSECIQMQTYMIPARLTLSMDLCSPAETIASECLRSGRVSWDSIARIMELLPQDSSRVGHLMMFRVDYPRNHS